jgi:hypothetical protein
MANTFSKTGITTGNTVEAWHVTQSIDAFSGISAYDVSLSGSFNMTGSINGGPGVVNSLTASYAMNANSASYALTSATASFVTGTVNSASYAPNFANTNLTFSGDRAHDTNGNYLEITTDGGNYGEAFIYMDSTKNEIGYLNNFIRVTSSIIFVLGGSGYRIELNPTETVFNEFSSDVDFRIESDNNPNMFFLDAGTDRIGIRKSNPSTTLDISGSTSITGSLLVNGSINNNIGSSGNSTLANGSSYISSQIPTGTSTSTAAWSTVATIVPASERVTVVEAHIVGRKIASPMSGSYNRLVATFLNSGSLDQIGTTARLVDHSDFGTTDARITTSGGNIVVQVFGLAGENITWYSNVITYDLI